MTIDNYGRMHDRESAAQRALPELFALAKKHGAVTRYPDGATHVEFYGEQLKAFCAALSAAAPKAAAAPEGEPDMLKVCEALGFDPTNHHNALKCPYCRPADAPPGWKRTPNGWETA